MIISCKIRNGFYTYIWMPPVLKSKQDPTLKLHECVDTILDLIDTL